MWKAVNDSEKTQRLMRDHRTQTLSQLAGSLNLFGSGPFSDLFLSIWMKDQFIDYAAPRAEQSSVSGSKIVRSVVSEDRTGAVNPAEELQALDLDDQALLGSLSQSLVLTPAPAPKSRRTNSIYIQPFAHTMQARNATSDHISKLYTDSETRSAAPGSVHILEGEKLSLLLQERPELAEYLYMEICAMRDQV
jgi:hypothetical protein